MSETQEQLQNPAEEIQKPLEQAAEPQEEIEIIEKSSEETQGEGANKEPKAFDPKTDRVSFSTPEQEAKFNHVYKQMKMSDGRNQMLNEMLQTATKRIDDLEGRFKNTDSADAERMLMYKIKSARDSGDEAAEFSALNELVEFKADKKLSETVAKSQRDAYQPNQQDVQNTHYVASLMQEVDPQGNPIRPYLYESHPDFESSIENLEKISQKYIGDPQGVQKALAELDQFMRAKMTKQSPPSGPQSRTPNPMQGSNLTNVNKKTTIKMTQAELDVAKKLGIDPKRYAARRDKINGSRK